MNNPDEESEKEKFSIAIRELAAAFGVMSYILCLTLFISLSLSTSKPKGFPVWLLWVHENCAVLYVVIIPLAIYFFAAALLWGLRTFSPRHLQDRFPWKHPRKPQRDKPKPIERPHIAIITALSASLASGLLILATANLRVDATHRRKVIIHEGGLSDHVEIIAIVGWYGSFWLIIIANDVRSRYKNRWKGLATFAFVLSIANVICSCFGYGIAFED